MFDKLRKGLTAPSEELGKWSRFAVLQLRIWFHFGRLFIGVNRCLTQAAALAYHSIFGLVPLVIVMLMVFQMFPAFDDVSEKVKSFLYDQMNLSSIKYPTAQADAAEPATIYVSDKLDELTRGYISKANTGAITVVGLVLVIWAAVALLTTIEKTFNQIYHVSVGRGFLHRLFNYWALLTLGPLLLALGIYVSTTVMKHELVQKLLVHDAVRAEAALNAQTTGTADPNAAIAAAPADPNAAVAAPADSGVSLSRRLSLMAARTVPFLVSLLGFFMLYFFLPNTRVSPGSALWGAFVAALIWQLAKAGFGLYVTKFVPQFAVYGVLGIIPLTVMWIYVSWLIVLFGLQLTYATQNVKRLDAAEFAKMQRQNRCFLANDQTVIRVMEYVLNAFERKDQKPVSVEAVAYRMGMPTDFTEKILERMVDANLLCRTDDPVIGYVPSTDGTHITLDEISRSIGEVSFAQAGPRGPAKMIEVFDRQQQLLSGYTLKEVLNADEDFSARQALAQDIPDDESPDA